MNVLIAEDQQLIRMAQAAVMARWGFGCGMAANGAEAVELVRRNAGCYDRCPIQRALRRTSAEARIRPALLRGAQHAMLAV
jgi:hypothetical protein